MIVTAENLNKEFNHLGCNLIDISNNKYEALVP